MGVHKATDQRGAVQKQFWAAYLLLFIAILGPVTGVIWLVQRAVGNERVVYEAQLAESRLAQLRAAELTLEQSFSAQLSRAKAHLDDGSPGSLLSAVLREDLADAGTTLEPLLVPETSEEEAAQGKALLVAVRAALATAEPMERAAALGRLLEGGSAGLLRMSSGRSVAAMAALLAIDELPTEVIETQLYPLFRTIALDAESYPMPTSQRRFFLSRVLQISEDAQLRRYLEAATLVEDWRTALTLLNQYPPSPGMAQVGETVYVSDDISGVVLLYRKGDLMKRLNPYLAPGADGYQAIQLLPEATASDFAATGSSALNLSGVLSDWTLVWVPDPALEPTNQSMDRITGYLAIGGIVLVLSTIAGLTVAVLIRRQINLAELKNDLVATVSHELKTPIASTRLLVETLLNDPNPSPQKTRDYLEHIARENKRLGHLIENFLSFSRMERDKNNFDLEPTDPAAIAREMAAAFEDRFRNHQVTFEFDVEPSLPNVLADGEAIQTALGNLIENALKYAVSGNWIRLRVTNTAKGVRFEVEDRGPGIPKADQRKIFKRFYQGNRKLTEHTGGVGLGLSIVSFIADKHQGTLELESEPGRGSTFKLTLPHA